MMLTGGHITEAPYTFFSGSRPNHSLLNKQCSLNVGLHCLYPASPLTTAVHCRTERCNTSNMSTRCSESQCHKNGDPKFKIRSLASDQLICTEVRHEHPSPLFSSPYSGYGTFQAEFFPCPTGGGVQPLPHITVPNKCRPHSPARRCRLKSSPVLHVHCNRGEWACVGGGRGEGQGT